MVFEGPLPLGVAVTYPNSVQNRPFQLWSSTWQSSNDVKKEAHPAKACFDSKFRRMAATEFPTGSSSLLRFMDLRRAVAYSQSTWGRTPLSVSRVALRGTIWISGLVPARNPSTRLRWNFVDASSARSHGCPSREEEPVADPH